MKFDSLKYLAQFSSYLINDKVRRYEGYDYEKVTLTTQMALNLLALGDFDGARTEIKKTHEREDLISTLREQQYFTLEQQAKAQGISLHYKELQGYPIATLDAPEVLELKNSYQSAFSHYLAGFVYEALGERGLAAPGYRKAIELRPHVPFLEQALLNLGKPAGKADESEVLIIVQSGLAPKRDSVRLLLSVEIDGEAFPTIASFPVMVPDTSTPPFNHLQVDSRQVKLTELNSISAMSRRALRDDMPGIILRTTYRAQSSASFQAHLKKKNDEEQISRHLRRRAILEDADTRTWRTLPDTTLVARLRLKQGEHQLRLPNTPHAPPIRIKVDQRFQVISLRAVSGQVFISGQEVRATPHAEPTGALRSSK